MTELTELTELTGLTGPLILAVLSVIALAVLVRSVWGFGDAMLAVPLLAWLLGIEAGAPLLALLGLVIGVALLRERPELVELGTMVRLLGGAVFGVPVGLWVLVGLPSMWAHLVLGMVLVSFSLWSLSGRRLRPREGAWLDLAFGFLAGASSAAFNIAGPPLLIYAAIRGWSPDELRVNLQAVFLPLAILTTGAHAAAGLWTPRVLILAGVALPVVALVLWLGPKLRVRLAQRGGDRFVYAMILILGLAQLGSGALALRAAY